MVILVLPALMPVLLIVTLSPIFNVSVLTSVNVTLSAVDTRISPFSLVILIFLPFTKFSLLLSFVIILAS
ncbi:hypothetical protein CVP04_10575 [Caviibacterium pharyngocola]|uniref:Uncharacterized protein n=1 Tax=Caviibacterium pharyngocola TaxID=28159 RepID=A0A2M8RTG3_9PAST|nr:hypothetical protein CVP04_10575 [Caviibacterium pharyngocola]